MDRDRVELDDVNRAFPSQARENSILNIYSLSTSYIKRFSSYGNQEYTSVSILPADSLYGVAGENKLRKVYDAEQV